MHLRGLLLERTDNDAVQEIRRDDGRDETDGSGDGQRHSKVDAVEDDSDHGREQHDSCVPQAVIEPPALVPEPKSALGVESTEQRHCNQVQQQQSWNSMWK
jgi:hypothetical protein